MATPTLSPSRTASKRCPVHHQPAALCGSPELADAFDTLRGLRIDPTLVDERHMSPLDDCGGCADADWPRGTAVAHVSYTASSGVRYSEDACPLCLGPIVEFWRKHATDVAVYLPIPAGAFGSVVAVS